MKKILRIPLVMLLCFSLPFFLSCILESSDVIASSSSSEASGSSFSASKYLYVNLSTNKASDDNSSWSEISSSQAAFLSGSVKVSLSDSVLIKIDATDISESLWICLSGTMTSGGVKIQTSTENEIGLLLDGVSITSSDYPCIDMTKGGAVSVFLKGSNTLSDGRAYGKGYGDSASGSQNPVSGGSDSKGSLYCKGGLAICQKDSDATLSVTQAYKNCIASKDGYLKIESGTIELKNYTYSSSNPISDYSSIISSGKIGKNGLFGGQGITVSGGSVTFYGCGIITTSDVRKANAFKTDDDDYPSSFVRISGGAVSVETWNGKGINAPVVEISGGTNTFTVGGVTGYTSDNKKSGSWYDADGVEESGYITFAAEGLEGESEVTISDGKTQIGSYSNPVPDDGLNVSGTGGSLVISGGSLAVFSKGDGLDSNGSITISGGITVVCQTGSGNSPIDCGDNYKFTVTGSDALVFAIGASGMFSESIPSSSVNPMIYSKSLSGSAGASLAVEGNVGVASPLAYEAAILVSSNLTNGESYSFVKGGTVGGSEIFSGIFYPATVSGGTTTPALTASTSSSYSASSGGNGNSNGGGPGGGHP